MTSYSKLSVEVDCSFTQFQFLSTNSYNTQSLNKHLLPVSIVKCKTYHLDCRCSDLWPSHRSQQYLYTPFSLPQGDDVSLFVSYKILTYHSKGTSQAPGVKDQPKIQAYKIQNTYLIRLLKKQETVYVILRSPSNLDYDLSVDPNTWQTKHKIYKGDLTYRLLRNYKLYFP